MNLDGLSQAQQDALAELERQHGKASYLNTFKPESAIFVDFWGDEDHSYRIEPDGKVHDMMEALLYEPPEPAA